MIEVIPGILEKEFDEIYRKIRLVEQYIKWVQIDVLDGSLFNNTCFNDPKPFSHISVKINLEVHLMVKKPIKWVDKFNLPQFQRFIAHLEGFTINNLENEVNEYIKRVKSLKKEVALAIDLPTSVDKIFPFLGMIDQLLIMTINTGRSGQSFAMEAVEKISDVRTKDALIPIEVDGGISPKTAPLVAKAGANRLAATSSIFEKKDIKTAIYELKKAGENID